MQATAKLKYLLMSPRKVRRVVALVRGKSVEDALSILKFTNKAAAGPLAKTIQSATANALAVEGTSKLKAEDLAITRICVDEGPRPKRIEFRAMGRANRWMRRFSYITVVVEGTPSEEAAVSKSRVATKESDKAEAKPEAAAKKRTGKKAGRKTAGAKAKAGLVKGAKRPTRRSPVMRRTTRIKAEKKK